MTHAALFTGGGDYRDPWHPFADTARRIARLLAGDGIEVTTVDTVAGLRAALGGAELLVVQAGSDERPSPHDDELIELVRGHLAAGRPLLAMHASAGILPDHPEWARLLGGRWVRAASWHPEHGTVQVLLRPHAITDGLDDFAVSDERYTELELEPGIEVLAEHDEAGTRHPLAWAHRVGRSRVVYDALGHDSRSYDSPGRREVLRREVRWLLAAQSTIA